MLQTMLLDTTHGTKLVLITDSTVLLIRNLLLNGKGKSKKITVVICLGVLIILGNVEPAEAKDNWFLLGAEGFTPPLSRPAPNNQGYFGSKTTSSSSSGAPKKDPNEKGTSQNPAMKKYSQATPTSHHDLSARSKKKNKQCSLKDEQKRKS